jgi:ABC-type glutathione transport system ATPase component
VAAIPNQSMPAQREKAMLSLQDFSVFYTDKENGIFGKKQRRRVVKSVNLNVYEGEILGIVGESGSGKSTLAKAIVGLNTDTEGKMNLDASIKPQMVFQDPFGSLNPSRTIGWILEEPLRVSGIRDKKERQELVCSMLQDVGLNESYYGRYPRELSGGQRQRISIAAALLMNSKLLVADEPVSALDVTVQSQILNLLLEVHKKKGLTLVFISHDLNIVRHICHRVAVMYEGEIVEMGTAEEVYRNPQHPYMKQLLKASSL